VFLEDYKSSILEMSLTSFGLFHQVIGISLKLNLIIVLNIIFRLIMDIIILVIKVIIVNTAKLKFYFAITI